ncbi:MAG: hypothetical protein LBD86_01605, partial [Spirochaetaceae bacterium]|nr:hypothetical protein [Spirochaetaceae bacterium]
MGTLPRSGCETRWRAGGLAGAYIRGSRNIKSTAAYSRVCLSPPSDLDWTYPDLVDTKISGKYNNRRGEKDGNERQRTAGIPCGIQG